MVLVRQRCTEERHDPVAHDLVHRALIAVDGLHHALQHRIEDLARLLGIAVGEQLHRALEVGEEHRDLLALAFQGGLGGEDLLGEVRCTTRGWRSGPLVRWWRRSAGPAELLARRDGVPQLGQAASSRAPQSSQNSPPRRFPPGTGDTSSGASQAVFAGEGRNGAPRVTARVSLVKETPANCREPAGLLGLRGSGGLIHTTAGRAGGMGRPRGKRSGCAA